MEAKKNKNLELNHKRGLFFNIGLVISLLMVISAFETRFETSYEKADIPTGYNWDANFVPPTIHDDPMPPAPTNKSNITVERVFTADPTVNISPALLPGFTNPIGSVDGALHKSIPAPGDEVDSGEIFVLVEKQPEPKGGYENFYKYIRKNLKYPSKAQRYGVDGRVLIGFIVDKDGSVTNVEVLRGIGFGCDDEAVRVISGSKWNPGRQRGVPVKVRMAFPVVFKN